MTAALSPATPSPAAAPLDALRAAMAARGVDACVVFSGDPHLSEYLPEHWQARQWFSGFDGSAGTLVVLRTAAFLWTDSRYWTQAEAQLQPLGIVLMRAGDEGVPDIPDWLATQLSSHPDGRAAGGAEPAGAAPGGVVPGGVVSAGEAPDAATPAGAAPSGALVAVDGRTWSLRARRQWRERLASAGLRLDDALDLPGLCWPGRPALPRAPIYEHALAFAVRTRQEKLDELRLAMSAHGAGWHWLSSLDDVAWLLNLRGSDVEYNPVFLAHLLLSQQECRLYVAPGKLPPELAGRLEAEGVQLLPYESAQAALARLGEGERLLLDPSRCAAGLLAGCRAALVEAINPTQLSKARKQAGEAEHIRQAMIHDGAALCEFFAWFETAVGGGTLTELDVDARLLEARARQPHFVSPSFATIAAFNANGAMPHYRATPDAHARLQGDGLLLIDSGGQYLGGTTDITRMVPVGRPSAAQRRDVTLVLRGMIALSQAVFPEGMPAPLLDPIARMPLWQAGLDYGHGTGHGVGYFLNVHEGPQAISHRAILGPHAGPQLAMRAGMVTSNEPGLYRPGQWGVRVENLVLAVPGPSSEFGGFLAFETLTLCPIDTRCLDVTLLSEAEKAWLNGYHRRVGELLSPLLQGEALAWLRARTKAV